MGERRWRAPLAGAMAVLVWAGIAACGDDEPGSGAGANNTSANAGTNNANNTGTNNANNANNNANNTGTNNANNTGTNNANNANNANNGEPTDDQDGDGVRDADELAAGTDPASPDTDGDGFWDGWERAAGSDGTDPSSVPELELPAGEPYKLVLTQIVEPSALAPLAAGRLDSVPPILVFVEGLTDGADDGVVLTGGLGTLLNNGEDEVPGTADDVYTLRFSSFSQITGDFLIGFEGRVTARQLQAGADEIVLDLTGISDITEGLTLRVESVEIVAQLSADLEVLSGGSLQGELTRQGVEELAEKFSDILPLDPETLLGILDADGDGLVAVHFEFQGEHVRVEGIAPPARDVETLPRGAGACCPAGAAPGDPIDPFLVAGVRDQGIQPGEEALAARALDALLADEDVLHVATMRVVDGVQHYFVYSQAGHVEFMRIRGAEGTRYEVVTQEGVNPVEAQDAARWSTWAELSAYGGDQAVANPSGTVYPDKGYAVGDERLHFIEPSEMTYPYAYERIAAYFDDPRAGDMAVEGPSWGPAGFSSHGHLGALQSRSPLILSGPGLRTAADTAAGAEFAVVEFPGDGADPVASSFLYRTASARVVDIAPTVAAALGVERHPLAVRDGRFTDDAYLAWQDGRPLLELFTEDAAAQIERGEPVADYALIIINDGLTSVEILHEAETPGFDVSIYRALMRGGVTMQQGSITNWPSNTYPSHNAVAAGVYSGHHGIIGNTFYEREVATVFTPIADLVTTEKYYGSAHVGLPVETLYEAVHRSFGTWDGSAGGVFTASVNDPSSRGATYATLERRRPEGVREVQTAPSVVVGGQTYMLPEVDLEDYEGFLDNSSVLHLHALYLGGQSPIPRLTVVNFASTDGGGHTYGPHGDVERGVVIPRVNERLEIVRAILEEAGILDRTFIVLTSDHGMELRDRSRQGSPLDGLYNAGVRFTTGDNVIYFKTLSVQVAGALSAGGPGEVTFTVADEDTTGAAEVRYAVGAQVTVRSGAEPASAVVGRSGSVALSLTPLAEAGEVVLDVTHPDFTAAEISVPVR